MSAILLFTCEGCNEQTAILQSCVVNAWDIFTDTPPTPHDWYALHCTNEDDCGYKAPVEGDDIFAILVELWGVETPKEAMQKTLAVVMAAQAQEADNDGQ